MAKKDETKNKPAEQEAETTAPATEETSGNAEATPEPEQPEAKTTEETGSDEVVEVSKADLADFMRRMNQLEEDNKKLLAVADKSRMSALTEEERQKKTEAPIVKLSRMGGPTGKLVIAWKLTKNESYVDGNRLVEHQTIQVFYKDGTTEEMPLLEFYRGQNKDTRGKITKRSTDESGDGRRKSSRPLH